MVSMEDLVATQKEEETAMRAKEIATNKAAEEKVIIHVANKFKIPGIVLQHGIPPNTEYYKK